MHSEWIPWKESRATFDWAHARTNNQMRFPACQSISYDSEFEWSFHPWQQTQQLEADVWLSFTASLMLGRSSCSRKTEKSSSFCKRQYCGSKWKLNTWKNINEVIFFRVAWMSRRWSADFYIKKIAVNILLKRNCLSSDKTFWWKFNHWVLYCDGLLLVWLTFLTLKMNSVPLSKRYQVTKNSPSQNFTKPDDGITSRCTVVKM